MSDDFRTEVVSTSDGGTEVRATMQVPGTDESATHTVERLDSNGRPLPLD